MEDTEIPGVKINKNFEKSRKHKKSSKSERQEHKSLNITEDNFHHKGRAACLPEYTMQWGRPCGMVFTSYQVSRTFSETPSKAMLKYIL